MSPCARVRVLRTWILLALLPLLLAPATPVCAGTRISARCSACGYHVEGMPLFGGRRNFKTVCRFPALCPTTGSIVLINLLAPTAQPSACPGSIVIPYTDPALRPTRPGSAVATWRLQDRGTTIALYAGGYLCPRCRRHTLHFVSVGFWD